MSPRPAMGGVGLFEVVDTPARCSRISGPAWDHRPALCVLPLTSQYFRVPYEVCEVKSDFLVVLRCPWFFSWL